MNLLRILVSTLLPIALFAAPPPLSIDLDMSANTRAFKLAWAEGTTPLIRCNMKNAGAAYTVTGWTGTLYMQATWEDTSIRAVPSTATSGSVIDFQLTANMTATSGLFFANFVMTDGTSTVEWQRGTVDVRDSPGTDGAGTLTLTTALNWGDYTYSNTATEGPYRASTNITFEANADGSVDIIGTDTDTLAALSPTAGRILYGTGSAWATLAAGTAGYLLTAQGASAPTWTIAGAGDITGVTAGTGLTGGGASGEVTLTLANTAVTPGSYGPAAIAVDAQGRLTSASVASSMAIIGAIDNGAVTAAKLESTTVTPGSYGPSTITVDQQGRLTAAATTSSADIQTALGAVYVKLVNASPVTVTGEFVFTGGIEAASFFGDGVAITGLHAPNIATGTIAAARLGEQRILIGSRSLMLETTANCGWASFVSGNFHSDAIQSAATTLQTFTLGSDPIEVPYSFAAFRTTIAARITWNADDADSTDAKITGYRLIGYPSPDLTGSPTTLLTASGLSEVVTGASTITKIDINRSAFASTTVPRYIVALVDGSIRSNGGTGTTARKMAVMSVEIFSE